MRHRPPTLVVQVGSAQLRYHLRCIDDLHAMLKAHGDWMLLGSADEQKPAAEDTVEAWGRSAKNPVGGLVQFFRRAQIARMRLFRGFSSTSALLIRFDVDENLRDLSQFVENRRLDVESNGVPFMHREATPATTTWRST